MPGGWPEGGWALMELTDAVAQTIKYQLNAALITHSLFVVRNNAIKN